jgi:hypothetical protein
MVVAVEDVEIQAVVVDNHSGRCPVKLVDGELRDNASVRTGESGTGAYKIMQACEDESFVVLSVSLGFGRTGDSSVVGQFAADNDVVTLRRRFAGQCQQPATKKTPGKGSRNNRHRTAIHESSLVEEVRESVDATVRKEVVGK